MVEFGAAIKLDSASALEQMRKFAGQTTAASKALKQFQNEAKATAQGGGGNVFRKYINSSQKANQQILKSIALIHDQRKAFSKLNDEEKELISVADKLNRKYDESAAIERKLVNIRKELRIVTASGLKTQKEANIIFDREALKLKKSSRAYKENTNAKRKAFEAGKSNLNAIREARIAFDKEYSINRKVAAVKKQLILLLKSEKINRVQYNKLLAESRVKISSIVKENERMISTQQRMAKIARLVSVYSRLLLGTYAAIRVFKMFVDFEKTAEAVQLLTQKLEFLTGESGAYNTFFDMTQNVGIRMEDASKIITRFAVVTNRAFSIKTMSEWSSTLVQSARATGTSTQEMSGALIQITQAMSAGRLMGDEYRSVTENLPLLTVALRDMFGRSTSSLKELSSQGLITNEVLIEAFGRTKVLLEGFPDATNTIEASFGRLSSSWDNLISKMVDSNITKSISNQLAEFFINIGDAIDKNEIDTAINRIELYESRVDSIRSKLERSIASKVKIKDGTFFAKIIDNDIESKKSELKAMEDRLESKREALRVIRGESKGDLAKKAADKKRQDERELDRIYKEQQKTLQMIEKIQGGKSIANIKAKSVLEQNLLDQKNDMFNLQEAGSIKDEEYFRLSEIIARKRKLSIGQVVQKEIDAELRLNGFTTKNNIDKIKQELETTGRITAIRNKANKDRLTIASAARARQIGLGKKDYDPSKISKVTKREEKLLTGKVNIKELADVKTHIDGIYAGIESIGAAAQANTAKLRGDITGALGLEKASIISNYEKSIKRLDKQIKQFGSSTDFMRIKGESLNEARNRWVKTLKAQKDASIFRKEEDLTSSLEQKFDNGAVAVRIYNKEIIALTAAKDRLNMSELEHNRQLTLLKTNMEDQVNQSRALKGELSQFEQVILGMKKGMNGFRNETKTTFDIVADSYTSLVDNMVESIVDSSNSGKDAFKRMTESILKDIQRMILKSLILKTVSAITGSLGFGKANETGSFFQGADGADYYEAKGGVYSGQGISNYSNSIVNKPTMFEFAKGTAIMGEAGEEAIMPLTRLANGDLGIGSVGGSEKVVNNISVSVSIDQSGNTETKTKTNQSDGTSLSNILSNVVQKQLIKEMRPGGLLNRGGV